MPRFGERALIERIRSVASPQRNRAVRVGIGDDCAVLRIPAGHECVLTTDFSIEGVHFRREWQAPAAIGHYCMARCLSDIAAMGAAPVACFLSLALPRDRSSRPSERWLDSFLNGFLAVAREHGARLAGGDTSTADSAIVADVIAIGSVPRGRAILRSGARPGDRIYVTGSLGAAALALREQQRRRHGHLPQPQIAAGLKLRGIASAMIDTSDGLSTDLTHICEESGVAAEVDSALLPVARGATLNDALHGGEDYQLLFTAAARVRVPAKVAGVPIRQIGVIRKRARAQRTPVLLRSGNDLSELAALGWEHFRGSQKNASEAELARNSRARQ